MKKYLFEDEGKIKIQYLVDNKGKKTSVVLDIKVFEDLLEKFEDMYDIVYAENILQSKGRTYSLEEIEKEFKKKHCNRSRCKRTK